MTKMLKLKSSEATSSNHSDLGCGVFHIVSVERKGHCLRCRKVLVKNHATCNRRTKLIKKANKRGKHKRHYL